jgi:branched-subunit amino acid aminotransferase/4-amino-4-deoxychorismate lyase
MFVLISSSVAGGIFPVVEVDGRRIGRGSLGSITQRIRERYWERHLSGPDVTPVLA